MIVHTLEFLGLWLLVSIILAPFAGMYLRFRRMDDGQGEDLR